MPEGSLNAWQCPICGKSTVAVHVDEGVTPMMLGCRATPDCPGMARSAGYPMVRPVPADVMIALAWEWRKATAAELRTFDRAMAEHCAMGGLVLHPLTPAGREAFKKAEARS